MAATSLSKIITYFCSVGASSSVYEAPHLFRAVVLQLFQLMLIFIDKQVFRHFTSTCQWNGSECVRFVSLSRHGHIVAIGHIMLHHSLSRLSPSHRSYLFRLRPCSRAHVLTCSKSWKSINWTKNSDELQRWTIFYTTDEGLEILTIQPLCIKMSDHLHSWRHRHGATVTMFWVEVIWNEAERLKWGEGGWGQSR